MHDDIANLKRNYAESIRDMDLKWKQERKDRELEREKERENR